MNKKRMILKVFFEWLIFPFAFLLWKINLNSDGFANDYLFWHLCCYSDMNNQSITEVTKKTYRSLSTPRLR